jgi:hypothetical protein
MDAVAEPLPGEFNDNTTVVIRAIGERTADACEEHLRRSGLSNIFRVENVAPFNSCLFESIQLGIKESRPWTLHICISSAAFGLSGALG